MTFFFSLVFVVMVFWRPQDWLFYVPPQVRILWIVMGFTMLAMLLEASAGKFRFFRGPQVVLLFGFWLASMISHVVPHTYFAGMLNASAEVGKIVFFTFVLLSVLDRPRRLRILSIAFVVMALVMTLHAHLQYTTGAGFNGSAPLNTADGRGVLRIRSHFFGIFGDPNDLAQFLAVSIPFIFAIPKRFNFFIFAGCICLAGVLVYGVQCTWSRGGMIALAVLAIFPVLLILPARWLPVLIGTAALGALALTPFAGSFLDVSAHDRVVFWGMGNEHFKAYPIFGIGYEMFWTVASARSAHNAFVQCYAELGIFGFWFWFGLIVLGVVGAWRVRILLRDKELGEDETYLLRFSGLAIAALSAFCASSFFLSRAYVYPLFFLIAITGCIPRLLNIIQSKTKDAEITAVFNPQRDMLFLVSVASISSIAYIYTAIILLNAAWY